MVLVQIMFPVVLWCCALLWFVFHLFGSIRDYWIPVRRNENKRPISRRDIFIKQCNACLGRQRHHHVHGIWVPFSKKMTSIELVMLVFQVHVAFPWVSNQRRHIQSFFRSKLQSLGMRLLTINFMLFSLLWAAGQEVGVTLAERK